MHSATFDEGFINIFAVECEAGSETSTTTSTTLTFTGQQQSSICTVRVRALVATSPGAKTFASSDFSAVQPVSLGTWICRAPCSSQYFCNNRL